MDAAALPTQRRVGGLRAVGVVGALVAAALTPLVATPAAGAATATAPRSLTVPTPPLHVTASARTRSAVITWRSPADPGGSPIRFYRAFASPRVRGATRACATATSAVCAITGLVDGVAYRFTVRAYNSTGPSAASAPSTAVVVGAPTAVRALRVVVTTTARALWSAPQHANSGAVRRYVVRWSSTSGRTWGPWTSVGLSRFATRTRIVPGRGYAVQVRAVNGTGGGAPAGRAFTGPTPPVGSLEWMPAPTGKPGYLLRVTARSTAPGVVARVTIGRSVTSVSLQHRTATVLVATIAVPKATQTTVARALAVNVDTRRHAFGAWSALPFPSYASPSGSYTRRSWTVTWPTLVSVFSVSTTVSGSPFLLLRVGTTTYVVRSTGPKGIGGTRVSVPWDDWQPGVPVAVADQDGRGNQLGPWVAIEEFRDPRAATTTSPLLFSVADSTLVDPENGTCELILYNTSLRVLVGDCLDEFPGTDYSMLGEVWFWPFGPNGTRLLMLGHVADGVGQAVLRRNADGTVDMLTTLPTNDWCWPLTSQAGDWVATVAQASASPGCARPPTTDLVTMVDGTTGQVVSGHIPDTTAAPLSPRLRTCGGVVCVAWYNTRTRTIDPLGLTVDGTVASVD